MIAALSPAGFNFDETLSTLRFAQSVSCISNKTTSNVDEEADSLAKMRAEIAELKKLIEIRKNQKPGEGDDEDDLLDLQEMMNHQVNQIGADDDEEGQRKNKMALKRK